MGKPAAKSALHGLRALMKAASWDGAALAPGPARAHIDLRARGDAVTRAASVLRVASLAGPNRVLATPRAECYWLGPAEWLLVASTARKQSLLDALDEALGDDDGAAVDVSASRVVVELRGPSARNVLASCCAIDLHPRVFGPGQCASTLVAKAPILLAQTDIAPTYRIFIRPSLASYVIDWLTDGMEGVRGERSS